MPPGVIAEHPVAGHRAEDDEEDPEDNRDGDEGRHETAHPIEVAIEIVEVVAIRHEHDLLQVMVQ